MTDRDASIRTRALEPGDHDDWRRLWSGYLEFYETTLDDAVYAATWARLLAGDGVHGVLACDADGRALGLAHYLFHPHCWRLADVCYLQDLYVDGVARGGGVGRALIKAVYAEADRSGAAQVYWLTQDFNARARRLYDDVGAVTPFIKYVRP